MQGDVSNKGERMEPGTRIDVNRHAIGTRYLGGSLVVRWRSELGTSLAWKEFPGCWLLGIANRKRASTEARDSTLCHTRQNTSTWC